MAYGKRTHKRKAFKKRRTNGNKNRANYSVARSSPISDRYFCKLNYTSLHALTYTGLGAAATYQFRLNALFDPDLTGVGHQPMGYDQLAALYQRYRVYGCKWKVTFVSQDTGAHLEAAVEARPNTSIQTNMQDILEKPYVKKVVLGVEGSGQAVKSISGYTSIAKIRGVSKQTVKSEGDYGALTGLLPTHTPCLNIYIQNMNTAATATCNFRINLTYFSEFSDRTLLTGS